MTTPKPIEPQKRIAETINGRLAMMGLLAAVVNYGFTGWVIPGFF